MFASTAVLLALVSGCATLHAPKIVSAAPKRPLTESEAKVALAEADLQRDQAQCAQAIKLWEAGKTEQCRHLLDQILARNSHQPQAKRLLADLALEEGDAKRAERLLLELIKDHPNDEAAKASLAWLYDSLGRETEAQTLFRELDDTFGTQGE